MSALLSRSGRALVRQRFEGRAGSNLLTLRVGRTPKAGQARLFLTHRSTSGELVRAGYRLRLPR